MRGLDVVVGGGIAGLLATLLLSERDDRAVLLIEREGEVGGLLRCFDYGEYGRFDYGMHNMYETGIAELDALLFGLLPEDHWQILEGPRRDLAGLYFQGALQHHSPFPDLRQLPNADRGNCLLGFFRQLDSDTSFGHENALDDAATKFGAPIAEFVIDAAVRKQFGKPAREMATFATRLTTLNRVVMFGESSFADLMRSNLLRERLAYPEQRNLPGEWASGRKAYYPRNYGMSRVIDAITRRLEVARVQILTGSQIESIGFSHGSVESVTIASRDGQRVVDGVNRVVWTSGIPGVAAALGIDTKQYAFDPPRKTVVVNLLLRNPINMGDLYYFYCYDTGYRTFRVTNFGAYCDGAVRAGAHPVAVELLLDNPVPDATTLKEIAITELQSFGVLRSREDIIFCAAEPLVAGFPMPSIRNFNALQDLRHRIRTLAPDNLVLLGILSEENIFFQREVLAQTFLKLIT